jgi:hypothetical protein
MIDELTPFVRRIQQAQPSASTAITRFGSGGWMLDVRIGERIFVMACSPTNGFGVDEIVEGAGFESGYRFHSTEFASSADFLLSLMAARQAA